MTSPINYSIAFVLVIFLSAEISFSQTEKSIVDNYRLALKQTLNDSIYQSTKLQGTMSMEKLSFPVVVYFRLPNTFRMEMQFQNLTFILMTNDSIKWEYNALEDKHSVTPVDEDESNKNGEDNNFDYANKTLLQYQELGYRLKLLGKVRLDSIEAYELELTKTKPRVKSRYYIGTRDNLLYKIIDEKGERIFSHYKIQQEFVFPLYIKDSGDDQPYEARFSNIEINLPLPDTLFEVPKHVLEMKANKTNQQNSLFDIADGFFKTKQYDSAVHYYTKIITEDAGNFRAHNSRGFTRLQQKEYYDAIADFSKALEIDPNHSTAYNNRGLAKYYLGDNAGAIKDYDKSLSLNPSVVTHKNKGTANMNMSQYEQAIADFDKALTLDPEDAEAHYKRGVSLAQLNRLEDALLEYNKALSLNLRSGELFNYKGVSEYRLERYDSARNSFAIAVKLNPENTQYIENHGRALYELHEYALATEQFASYLKLEADNSDIHNLIGLCKYHEENYKGAIKDFTKAIELKNNEAVYYDNRAAAKEMIEDYEGAIADYSESIRVYPNDASVFYKRGMIKIHTSRKLDGCLDLSTAKDMQYEPAKEAIMKNCN